MSDSDQDSEHNIMSEGKQIAIVATVYIIHFKHDIVERNMSDPREVF